VLAVPAAVALAGEDGVAGEHQGVRANSMVAPARPAMARGLLATCTATRTATATAATGALVAERPARGCTRYAEAGEGDAALGWDKGRAQQRRHGACSVGHGCRRALACACGVGGEGEAESELGRGAGVSASTLTRGEGRGAWNVRGRAVALHERH
jgi:hypothetical protein